MNRKLGSQRPFTGSSFTAEIGIKDAVQCFHGAIQLLDATAARSHGGWHGAEHRTSGDGLHHGLLTLKNGSRVSWVKLAQAKFL